MKSQKLSVLVASIALSACVTASPKLESEPLKTEAKTSSYSQQQTDFGHYIVERSLALVPTTLANNEKVVSVKGDMAVVELSDPSSVVTEGTLVRNKFTGNLAPLSGNIKVLLKSDVTASDIEAETGLDVSSSFSGTKIAVVTVKDGGDILEARGVLLNSGLVKKARIEVLEVVYEVE